MQSYKFSVNEQKLNQGKEPQLVYQKLINIKPHKNYIHKLISRNNLFLWGYYQRGIFLKKDKNNNALK